MIPCRFYHVSCVAYSLKKQGIKLNKLLNPKSKKQWYPAEVPDSALPSVRSLAKVKYVPGKQGVRRLAMLNKLFMKSITDLMSTGTVAMGVVGRGIEISKVDITPDFQTVNVFWVCKGTSNDEETERILNKVAGGLRHELSTLRVMGEVPYIVFVKDKQESRLVDLDRRLSSADYGEDYTPTQLGQLLKSEFTLDTTLSPEIKAKIKQLEDDTELTEEPIPEMTHSIYGLDYMKILNRLQAARKKTKDAWVSLDGVSPVISYRAPAVKTMDAEVEDQRQELADFLMKRQILQKKLAKQLRDPADLLLSDDKEKLLSDEEDQVIDDELDDDEEFYDGTGGHFHMQGRPESH